MQLKKKKHMHVTYITILPILAICFYLFCLDKITYCTERQICISFQGDAVRKNFHLHKQTDFYLVTFTRNHFCNKNHNVRCWQAKREGVSVNMFVSKRHHVAWSLGRELLHSGMIAATHIDADK